MRTEDEIRRKKKKTKHQKFCAKAIWAGKTNEEDTFLSTASATDANLDSKLTCKQTKTKNLDNYTCV